GELRPGEHDAEQRGEGNEERRTREPLGHRLLLSTGPSLGVMYSQPDGPDAEPWTPRQEGPRVPDDQQDHQMPDRYVDVEGGRLAVHEFGPPDASVVLAAHGITANALSFAALARSMPDVRIIAPDLRG